MTNSYTSKRSQHAVISYNGKGIITIVLDDQAEITIEEVIAQRKISNEFTKGIKHVVLAIAGAGTSATKEAREYSSQNIPEGRLAEAIIIKSMPVRLMGKVFINFHKPEIPMELFESEEEAIKWLEIKLVEAEH